MCLRDVNQPKAGSELIKLTISRKLQIAYVNEELEIIQSQVNSPIHDKQQAILIMFFRFR